MTSVNDLPNTPEYRRILDEGFIYIVDTMGSDADIVQAARTSYGKGTKSVSDNRALIRYLIRHAHSSPVEMAEIKFHIKAPIATIRQLVRHRTANLNEYSARYSELTDEFYLPALENIKPQSITNKQGRSGEISLQDANAVQDILKSAYDHSYLSYQKLLGEEKDGRLSDEFYENKGVARELARLVMPVAGYTELYWKMDLRNLIGFLKLRADSHAQLEIRVYADAIIDLITPLFPLTMEAATDYIFEARNFSRMDILLVRDLILGNVSLTDHDNKKHMAAHYGMTQREHSEIMELLLKR